MSKLIITLPMSQQYKIKRELKKALKEILIDHRFLPMYLRDAMSGTLGDVSDLINVTPYI